MSLSRNIGSFNQYNFHLQNGTSEILEWLSPLEQSIPDKEVQSCWVQNVGDRLLHTEVFRSWSNSSHRDEPNNPTLFGYGDPGAGKTCITSLVIDTLSDQFSHQNAIIACFYFDFDTREEQSPTDMLGSLVKQIVSGLAEIPEEVAKEYKKHKRVAGGRRPRLSEIQTMLQTVSTSQRTFICIDALDECVAEHRQVILKSLREILEKSPSVKLFLTGRSYIRGEVQTILSKTATFMEIKPNKGDIITYIRAKLEEDTNEDAMNDSLRADILHRVPEEVSGIFLLVSQIMEAILREQKTAARRDRLKEMATALRSAYDSMLSRLKAQGEIKEEIGMAALMWASHSERPLKVDELCHALAVEIGSEDLDPENAPSIGTLLNCCQGLLVVDEETTTVRLIHSTLKKYLSTRTDLFDRAHSTIAETCLTYLKFRRFKGLPTSDPVRPPFLEYCSIYWGAHAKKELSDCAKSLALELFNDYDEHISIKLLLKDVLGPDHPGDINTQCGPSLTPPSHDTGCKRRRVEEPLPLESSPPKSPRRPRVE